MVSSYDADNLTLERAERNGKWRINFFQLTLGRPRPLSCQKMSLTKLQFQCAPFLRLATSPQREADCVQPSRIAD
jgi:hypothetical protein